MANLKKTKTLAGLPIEWPEDLMPSIQAQLSQGKRKVVVLDDDPTGTQTVHHVPVLTHWTVEELAAELLSPGPVFYILTNSRSLHPEKAAALNREIGHNLRLAADQTQSELEIISRSDSTLRGHFPIEIEALSTGLNQTFDACLIIPFFLEGGRFTLQNVHYVAVDDQLIPAGETEFARDATFGYRSSDLRKWVEEKTQGKIMARNIAAITLDDLRGGGPEQVSLRLQRLPLGQMCIVNAASYRDLEVLVMALLEAESLGKHYIFRTAASFVRVRAGISPQGLLERENLAQTETGGGLVVVGSHVPRSTGQLAALRSKRSMVEVELRVPELLNPENRKKILARAMLEISNAIRSGVNALVFTSRDLVQGSGARESLEISHIVSSSLVELVRELPVRPRFLVAKGGITSSDIATQGLGVQRAIVLGQILPGIPVWQLGPETRFQGLPYVVFPGNVGDENALVDIVGKLSGG
jgi:uncharacterized protein YgbK (DUF1537 family)